MKELVTIVFVVAIMALAALVHFRYTRFSENLVLDRLTGHVFVPIVDKP